MLKGKDLRLMKYCNLLEIMIQIFLVRIYLLSKTSNNDSSQTFFQKVFSESRICKKLLVLIEIILSILCVEDRFYVIKQTKDIVYIKTNF